MTGTTSPDRPRETNLSQPQAPPIEQTEVSPDQEMLQGQSRAQPLTLRAVLHEMGLRPQKPWLSREDSAELARLGPYGDGEFADVDPEMVPWGSPLGDIFAATQSIGAFLEAAAVAGHTGAVNEGVMMTLRAFQLWSLRDADRCEAAGVVGDALGACNSGHWRTMIALLHRHVAELEERAARLWLAESTTGEHVDGGIRAGWILEAARARERAQVAWARADEAVREIDDQRAATDRLWKGTGSDDE